MTIYTPQTCQQIQDNVQEALTQNRRLTITGTGTKQPLSPKIEGTDQISLSHLSGIIEYDPAELVITLRAGTRLDELEAILDKENQMLAFEPLYLDALYTAPHTGTIGGVMALNLSGSRRLSAGAARDFLLGFDAISGRGSHFRSGSRVMKNVTGYDLSKLICGSKGRLAIMHELTLKLTPQPETARSLCIETSDLVTAQKSLSHAFGTQATPSAGAIIKHKDHFQSFIRIEGTSISVQDRLKTLSSLLGSHGTPTPLSSDASAEFWHKMRKLNFPNFNSSGPNSSSLNSSSPNHSSGSEILWRLSLTPSQAPSFIADLESSHNIDYALDWAGGLIWLSASKTLTAAILQTLLDKHGGGHATLFYGSPAPSPPPPPTPLTALQSRIKTAFDPKDIFPKDILPKDILPKDILHGPNFAREEI